MSLLEQHGMFNSSSVPEEKIDVLTKYHDVIWFSLLTYVSGIGIVLWLYRQNGLLKAFNEQQSSDKKVEGTSNGAQGDHSGGDTT